MKRKPSLRDLELWMKSRILPNEKKKTAKSKVLFNPQGGEAGDKRLSVYAEGYTARIHEALKEAYEAVRHLMGEKRFAELSEIYAEKYPSRDTNLSFAGRYLENFLKRSILAKKFPFLSDLARLEWRIVEAFHAFQDAPMDPSRLSELAQAHSHKVRITLQPSAALVSSHWPVFDLWNSRKTPVKEIRIVMKSRPQAVLVYRSGMNVRCELLDARQYTLLAALIKGQSLGKACETLLRSARTEEILPIAEWFSAWAKNGLIAHIGH